MTKISFPASAVDKAIDAVVGDQEITDAQLLDSVIDDPGFVEAVADALREVVTKALR